METFPIVTVICTCFNHALYVEEALLSVLNQSYPNIQLIVVDNASTDNSKEIIAELLISYPEVDFIQNHENLGICKAFNKASKLAKGKYLIDLSADDVLLLNRIQLQVEAFDNLSVDFGLMYSNVEEIDKYGKHIGYSIHKMNPPQGNVFIDLLKSHFIPAPSIIFRKDVFERVDGYNETLTFEDFDFWVKCAFEYKFYHLPIISTKKRVLNSSLSMQFYSSKTDKMLSSTLKTYLWAKDKLQNEEEKKAYNIGLAYYFRQSVFLGHFKISEMYSTSFISYPNHSILTHLALFLLKFKINLSSLYSLYTKKSPF